jgi:orotate phosphoribosyltransferase
MLARHSVLRDSIYAKRERLRQIIREKSLLRGEDFVLASGTTSKYYFDMKLTTQDPEGANLVGEVMLDHLTQYSFKYIGGLATGAIPIIVAVCMKSWPERPVQGFFVRDTAKDHGTRKLVDGLIEGGADVIIVDDVTTKGDSAMKAVDATSAIGCNIVCVVSLVDRREGATENFRRKGIKFESIFNMEHFR